MSERNSRKIVNREIFETAPIRQSVKHFVIPAIISSMITIFYSLADTLFVGHLNDANQLAGLTVAFPYYQLLNAFASLWGVGANSVMSRSLGEKRNKRVSTAASTGFWCSGIFMVIVCILFLILRRPLLNLAGASAATYGHASSYMFWAVVIGGIPTVFAIVLSNLFRAEGHAKWARNGLMLGGLLNVVLDPVFIFVFGLGIVGAAIATTISNVVSLCYFLILYFRIRENSYINIRPGTMFLEGAAEFRSVLKETVLVGLPSCCLTILGCLGCIVQTHLYSVYSDAAVAGWGVVNRVSFISITLTHGIGQGLMPLIGYNHGAGNQKRVRETNKWAIGLVLAESILVLILSELFSSGIIRIFTKDAATITTGAMILRIYTLCTPVMGIILLVSTLCQAVGKWKYSLLMLTIRQLIFNIPLTFLLHHLIGLPGVPLAQPVCDVINCCFAIFYYRMCFVKPKRISAETNKPERE